MAEYKHDDHDIARLRESVSDAEDEAAGFGLCGLPLNNGAESLYFGLVGSTADGSDVIMPFIHPDKEAFLEYDIANIVDPHFTVAAKLRKSLLRR